MLRSLNKLAASMVLKREQMQQAVSKKKSNYKPMKYAKYSMYSYGVCDMGILEGLEADRTSHAIYCASIVQQTEVSNGNVTSTTRYDPVDQNEHTAGLQEPVGARITQLQESK